MKKKDVKKKISLALCLGIAFGTSSAYAADSTLGEQIASVNNTTVSATGYLITATTAVDTTNGSILATVNNSTWVSSSGDASATAFGLNSNGYAVNLNGTATVLPITTTALGGTSLSGAANAMAYGISSTNSNSIATINGDTKLTTNARGGNAASSSAYAYAFGIRNNIGTAAINGAATITAVAVAGTTSSSGSEDVYAMAYGIRNNTAGSTTTITGATTITATAMGGSGPNSSGFADGDSYGIYNYGTAAITGNTIIESSATGGSAVQSFANSFGVFNSNNGTTTIIGDTTIVSNAKGGTTSLAGYTDATADGIYNYSGQTTINGAAVITATATGGTINSSGSANAYAHGIVNDTGTTKITGNTTITASAAGGSAVGAGAIAAAYGIKNAGTGSTTLTGDTTITATATGGRSSGASGSAYAKAYGIYTFNGATTIDGNITITAKAVNGTTNTIADEADAYALYSENGTININPSATKSYTARLTGDIAATWGSVINVSLNNSSSFLRGNVLTNNSGVVNFTLANNAVWQPVYNNSNGSFTMDSTNYSKTLSTINTLNLSGGIIDLAWDNPARATSRKLVIGTLSGNSGTIKISTDLANNTGDTVSIGTLSANSSMGIGVNYDSSLTSVTSPTTIYASGAGYKPVTITTSGLSSLALNGVLTENGAYSTMPNFINNNLTSLTVGTSSNTKAAASSASRQSQIIQVGINHLRKRLGDLRNDSNASNEIWARTYGGEISNDKYDNVEASYNGIQVGYDHKIQGKNGQKYLGGAVSYTASKDSFTRGTGNSSDTDFALYQTWIANDGHYYDLIAKHGYLRSDYQVTDLSNNYSTASYKTQTNSLSAEYGYRKQLKNNWYMEPQSELTYGHINSVNYTTSSTMNVAQKGIDRLIGRIGLGIGKKLDNGNHIYTSLSMLHEFKGEETIKASSLNYSEDLSGTWGEFILGIDAKLSDRSTGYINVEKLFGGDVSSNWQFNAGCRLAF